MPSSGTRKTWHQAVVVGGGLAGLVTARVSADHFERVVILDRDEPTADTWRRSGVPQAGHPRGLLAGGAAVLDELFPGFSDRMTARGAPGGDFGEKVRMLLPTGWAPTTPIGLRIQNCTRAFLESLSMCRAHMSGAALL